MSGLARNRILIGDVRDRLADLRPGQPRVAGQRDHERRALAQPAVDSDPAAMHVDDRLHDRQPQSAATPAGRVGQ